jgi:hypothetical protein
VYRPLDPKELEKLFNAQVRAFAATLEKIQPHVPVPAVTAYEPAERAIQRTLQDDVRAETTPKK